MKTSLSAVIALVVAVLSLTSCGEAAPERDPIRLQANAVGGGQVFYSDLASQDTVLWFWAPWWPHCKAVAPAVAEVETQYEDDIRFIGISGQDNADEMAGFVTEYGIDGFDHVADLNGEIWAVFGVSAQPSYVFINDDGDIRRHIGGMQPEELQAELDLLIER